jgi:signal transduction histidine kinase
VTAVVAISFQPLRAMSALRPSADVRGRVDPYSAIAGLGRTLASSLQLDAVLSNVVATVIRPSRCGTWACLAGDDATGMARPAPSTAPALTSSPFRSSIGIAVGELRLAARPGERLRERDRRLIADLAPQVAAAVRAVGLSQELQLARQRIVQLREEERRRIRRDLHDGLGPALAGLTFTLEAVRNLTESDLRRADELLVSATEQVQTMIGDVRRLIYGLRPATLDQLGLAASLRGLASQESSPGTSGIDARARCPSSRPPSRWRPAGSPRKHSQRQAARSCAHPQHPRGGRPTVLRLEVAGDGGGFRRVDGYRASR